MVLSDCWLFSTAGFICCPISSKFTCCSRLTHSLSPVPQLLYQSAGRMCQIPVDRVYVVEAERDREEEKKSSGKTEMENIYFSLASEQMFHVFLTHIPCTTSQPGLQDLISIGSAIFRLKPDRQSARKTCIRCHPI